MSRRAVLFNIAQAGHLNPMLALARQMVDAGWSVDFFAPDRVRERVEATGARWRTYGPSDWSVRDAAARVSSMLGVVTPAPVLQESVLLAAVEVVPGVCEQLRHLRPDLVVHDSAAPWGAVAAKVVGVPAVCLMGSHPGLHEVGARRRFPPDGAHARAVAWLREHHGVALDPHEAAFNYNARTVFTVPRGWLGQPERYPPERFRFWGPLPGRPDEPDPHGLIERVVAARATGRRVLYASLGRVLTVVLRERFHALVEDFFGKLVQAVGGRPDELLVLSTGGPLDLVPPDNVVVVERAPQPALLAHADVFITHAGMNATGEALAAQVPMLCVPVYGDQPMNAGRIVELGLGRALDYRVRTLVEQHDRPLADLSGVRVPDIREALDDLLGDPGYRQRLHALALAPDVSEDARLDDLWTWVQPTSPHGALVMTHQPRVRLGPSGPMVSPIALGCAYFGTAIAEPDAFALLDAYVAAGGNLLDTADTYASWAGEAGASERCIGRWLRASGLRDSVVIGTKVGGEMPYGGGLSAAHIRRAVDESLGRLEVDRIDLLWTHFDDPDTPLHETLGVLEALLARGTIGAVGLSNPSPSTLAAALARLPICAIQVERSLAVRNPEGAGRQRVYDLALHELCRANGLAVAAYSPLARGWLAGAGREGTETTYGNEESLDRRRCLHQMAQELGLEPATLALAWLRHCWPQTVPILGTSSVAHLAEALAAVGVSLSEGQVRHLAPTTPGARREPVRLPSVYALESVVLPDPDPAATAAWYGELLDLAPEADGAGQRLRVKGTDLVFQPKGQPALVFAASDVDAVVARLDTEVLVPPRDGGGQRMAVVRDPAGRPVMLRQRRDPRHDLVRQTPLVYFLVRDMDRAVRFYRDVLGLPVVWQWVGLWVEFQVGGLTLAIEPNPEQRVSSGLEGATVMFRISEGIEDMAARLEAHGAHIVNPLQVLPHGKLLSFHDPDGNLLQIHQGNPLLDDRVRAQS